MRTVKVFLTVVLAFAAPALVGCGGDGTAGSGSAGSPTTTVATTGTMASPGVPVPTATVDVEWTGTPTTRAAVLTGIRARGQEGSDRLVLEFDQPVAGYRVAYVPSIHQDPSGEPVDLAGSAFLQVIVQNATTDNRYQAGDQIPASRYAGPLRVRPDLPTLVEVQRTGDFESVLSFGIGVSAPVGFAVSHAEGPFRIVIDLAHP